MQINSREDFAPTEQINAIMSEMQVKYSLDASEIFTIVNSSITSVYNSELPVLIVDDGVYLVFSDEDGNLKYSKIKYSKQKLKQIVLTIDEKANTFYLKTQRDKVINFIKNKKPYVHAEYLYSENNKDYYILYFDTEHEQMISGVKAATPTQTKKKDRIFIDFTSAKIVKNFVYFMEHKKYVSKNNLLAFVKDVNTEIFKKIDKRIWIDVRNIDLFTRVAYLHLPQKTTRPVIEYIQKRVKEIFELEVKFVKTI